MGISSGIATTRLLMPYSRMLEKRANEITSLICIYIYISRILRNLSIHIARFSASESPRAYINTPKNPHFSLVAGSLLVAKRRGSDSACVSNPHGHSFFARFRDMLCSF